MKRKKISKKLKNGDEKEVLSCDSVFLNACIAQADH